MAKYNDYAINCLLTNGELFTNRYPNFDKALAAWTKLKTTARPLVVYASLHDREDDEIAIIGDSAA